MMALQAAQVDELRRSISEEILNALKLPPGSRLRRLLKPVVWPPAQRFARLAAEFDQRVINQGLIEAVRWVLPRFVDKFEAHGSEHIPTEGPLLIASNHPGAYDVLVILANLPREDVKLIASDFPFIHGLTSLKDHLIYVAKDVHARMLAVRSAIRHLQEGGAVMIYPSGQVDPDPALLPGADRALENWSPSLDLILRRVPQTRVLVTIVSGVLEETVLRNPLIRLPKKEWEQRKLAEFIQVIQQLVFGRRYDLTPKVSFGEPITVTELIGGGETSNVMQPVIQRAQQLLQAHLSGR